MKLKKYLFKKFSLSRFVKIFVALMAITAISNKIFACKIMPVPPIHPPTPPQVIEPLQTREHNVNVNIKDQVSEITVQATFFNPNNIDLEGDYWFPLYTEIAITSFSMMVNGKEMQAELLDADRARQIYEEIVRRRRDPALLEFVGMRMLRQRIFPIRAKSKVTVFLKYSQLLRNDSGVVQFKYPLSSAKPDKGKVDKVSISIFIESGRPIKNIYSSSHEIKTDKQSDNLAKIRFDATNYYPDKTFVLYYTLSEKDIGTSLISHYTGNEDGYFTLLISPKIDYSQEKVLPKDFVFVIDTSGSMSGGKIEGAKNALRMCIDNLNRNDRFNIIRFSSVTEPFKYGLIDATSENISQARIFIDRMTSEGGTAINEALITALSQLKQENGRIPIIVFLTDGQPTVGEQNIARILKNINSANQSHTRIFVFGVGSDVNTELLDKISLENNGEREYITETDSSIETSTGILYSKISNPVLTNVKLEFDRSIRIYDVYPQKLTDIFKGTQLVLTGRYDGFGEKRVKLTGRVGEGEKKYTYVVDFKKESKDEFVPRLWALRKITFLLNEINLKGRNEELVNEIIKLGKKFGIVTPYTSFLITDEALHKASLGGKSAKEAALDFEKDKVGDFAVLRSKQLSVAEKKGVGNVKYLLPSIISSGTISDEKLEEKLKQVILTIGDKTFIFQKNGYYYDTEYDPDKDKKIIEIKFLSNDYFRLIKNNPEISKYLSIAKKVVLKYKNKIYKVKCN